MAGCCLSNNEIKDIKGIWMKVLIIIVAMIASLYAIDFSHMSTEDMMHMRGSVPMEQRDDFRKEMQKRMQSMTQEERQKYGMQGKGMMSGQGMMGMGNQGMMGGQGMMGMGNQGMMGGQGMHCCCCCCCCQAMINNRCMMGNKGTGKKSMMGGQGMKQGKDMKCGGQGMMMKNQ